MAVLGRRLTDLEREKLPAPQPKRLPTDLEREKTPLRNGGIKFDDQKVDTSNVKVLGLKGQTGQDWRTLRRKHLQEVAAEGSFLERFKKAFVGTPKATFKENQPTKPAPDWLEPSIKKARQKSEEWEKYRKDINTRTKFPPGTFGPNPHLPKKPKITKKERS